MPHAVGANGPELGPEGTQWLGQIGFQIAPTALSILLIGDDAAGRDTHARPAVQSKIAVDLESLLGDRDVCKTDVNDLGWRLE